MKSDKSTMKHEFMINEVVLYNGEEYIFIGYAQPLLSLKLYDRYIILRNAITGEQIVMHDMYPDTISEFQYTSKSSTKVPDSKCVFSNDYLTRNTLNDMGIGKYIKSSQLTGLGYQVIDFCNLIPDIKPVVLIQDIYAKLYFVVDEYEYLYKEDKVPGVFVFMPSPQPTSSIDEEEPTDNGGHEISIDRSYDIPITPGTVVINFNDLKYGSNEYMYTIIGTAYDVEGYPVILMKNNHDKILAVPEKLYYDMMSTHTVRDINTNKNRVAHMFEKPDMVIYWLEE